ncbi:MAG: hypothetical protein QOH25_1010 [Acidobacteriota bacterium]|nr:hypothetical protein [Acidobacteriota bacterium]
MLGLANSNTLMKQAARLGLEFPRPGRGPTATQPSPTFLSKYCTDEGATEKKLNSYRMKWLNGMKLNPAARKTKALIKNKELANIYRWLLKNDTEWLNNHRPSSGEIISRSLALQKLHQDRYEKRDKEIAPAIENAIRRIRNQESLPMRLTMKTIFNEAGLITMQSGNLKNFPRTAKVLLNATETRTELAIRRIRWAADRFKEENIIPSQTKLLIRALVYGDIWQLIAVKKVVKQALRAIAASVQKV